MSEHTTTGEDEPASHAATRASMSSRELAADYSNWAQRLRRKKADAQQRVIDLTQEPQPERPGPSAYFDPDALFRDSRRAVQEEQRIQAGALATENDNLAVLGLGPGATFEAISAAHRALAKAHHPDRFAFADDDVKQHHADEMRRVNEAYTSLRSLHARRNAAR